VRASLEDVRRIAIELRPEALDDLGLESALAVLWERLAERSGLDVSFRVGSERVPGLSREVELVIYRVAQEALTNVARHSGSDTADLALEAHEDVVVLAVRDRDRGLERARPAGSGIRGMRERAGLIGATLAVRDRVPGPARGPPGVELPRRPQAGHSRHSEGVAQGTAEATSSSGPSAISRRGRSVHGFATTATAEAALAVAERGPIDLAVVDYHLGGCDGLWLSRKLKRLSEPPAVLIYSAYTDGVLAAVVAEADAILSKATLGFELCDAIRTVASGRRHLPLLSPAVAEGVRRRLDDQEQAIFGMLLAGIAPAEVARLPGCSVSPRASWSRGCGRCSGGLTGRRENHRNERWRAFRSRDRRADVVA
jgi:DNA-binding NarL/FixJ family response regulator